MSAPVIEVSGLGKKYIINHEQKAQYGSLRDNIAGFVKKPFEKKGQHLAGVGKTEEFWALKDVSFTVNKGEIFGVVGRNGSGKSTLLKTLSRIITPTSGNVTIHGRTASLLEVGTGFHPELTGRENVFFNGSMLGMSRDEIGKKFDEIVKFAEIEKFLDTPVKFYSSGMYVRLAFSVAAHLEPDVLILDEVLAVGDERFQRKSMQKIIKTMEGGTTVLFVSHSMDSVRKICNRGLLLDNGQINFVGPVDELTDRYVDLMKTGTTVEAIKTEWKKTEDKDNSYFTPLRIYITDEHSKKITGTVKNDQDHYLHIEGKIIEARDDYTIGYTVYNENKTRLYMSFESDGRIKKGEKHFPVGKIHLKSRLPKHFLNAGTHTFSLAVGIYNKKWIFDPEENTPSIQMNINGGLSGSPYWQQQRSGILAPVNDWEIE